LRCPLSVYGKSNISLFFWLVNQKNTNKFEKVVDKPKYMVYIWYINQQTQAK